MSSILKALRKLENDRSIGKPDQIKIDAKILQNDSSSRFSHTAVALIAVALFVCGSGAMYFFMKQKTSDVIAPRTISPRMESNSQVQTSVMPPPEIKIKEHNLITTSPPSTRQIAPVFEAHKRVPNDLTKISQHPQSEKQLETAPLPEPKPANAPMTSTGAASRPTLTINGIAFQDGGSDNMAVINGSTVGVGTIIEGVKVEDIQKDRVRFSQGIEKFEIILNKSNR